MWSGSGTPPSCGDGSPSPCNATSPAVPGCRSRRSGEVCKISYSKVVEFQARGAIHVHVPIRLDGPDGPDGHRPARR